MSFRIHFHDVQQSDGVRDDCEKLARELDSEFPETQKFEVTIKRTGEQHATTVHVTGKELDLAASARSHVLDETILEAFEKVRRQLRKRHDKVIFGRRREATRNSPKGA